MEPYVKTGYMLEQAFHTLTNIDFFIQGIHLHKLKAAIYEDKLAVLEALEAFGPVRLYWRCHGLLVGSCYTQKTRVFSSAL
jgi:alpha-mannosidase